MQILDTVRWVLNAILLSSALFMEAIYAEWDPQRLKDCMMEKALGRGSDWSTLVRDAINSPDAVQLNNLQFSIASRLPETLLQQDPTPTLLKEKKQKGLEQVESESITIPLVKFNPLMWLRKKKEIVGAVCGQLFKDLGDFCTQSLLNKEKNQLEFIAKNLPQHQSMRDALMRGEKPADMAGRYQFRVDDVTRGNMFFGGKVFLKYDDAYFSGPVLDAKGAMKGLIMTISTNGKSEDFFAPFANAIDDPALYQYLRYLPVQIMNPYWFVFGGVAASVWNKYWTGKLGALNYNGKSL